MSNSFGYPVPRQAPAATQETTEYQNVPANNPYLTGLPLTILSSIVASSPFLQRFFWHNAKFGTLRNLAVLKNYAACYHPLVAHSSSSVSARDDSALFQSSHDTTFYTSADYVEAYRSKKTNPVAVAEHLLSLIQKPPHKAAFIEVHPELTLAAAKASAGRYQHGTPLGPLDGVPIAVKDEVDIHGYTRTFGSAKVWDHGEGETAWSVKKLEDAGAIIIGKTNMHELGSDTTNNNPVKGTPRNPYNQGFYTGGSSGGSAYAVGSGLVPIAVGADGGGSIRLPSSYCGIYGIKTSHGRISGRPSPSLTTSNGVVGPMAVSLADLALAYRVMSEPDPEDVSSSSFPRPSPLLTSINPPARKVIGLWRPWFDDCSPAVSTLCNQAIQNLKAFSGYEIVEVDTIPYFSEARLAHSLSIITEMANFVNGDFSSLNSVNKVLLSVASQTMAADFAAANQVRTMMMSHFAWLWKQYPGMILVTPTVPNPGRKIQERELSAGVSDGNSSMASMLYVFLANFIGTPALNTVVGYDEESGSGIPIGLMGMGEWGTEEELFGWGNDVNENFIRGNGRKKGEVWVDVLGDVGGRA